MMEWAARLFALGALATTGLALIEFPDCEDGPMADNVVCDATASPAERAAALVEAMTIDEKLVNLVDNSLGAARLGLPPYEWWSEALHGVGYSPGVSFASTGEFSSATSFANPILMSAAFDDDLIFRVASVISTEARAFSNAGRAGLDFWTPNINPYKDPRWGRGMETPGEDPRRIKGYVKALLAGLEGDQETKKVIATCKHFAGNDLERWEEVLRYNFDAVISTQDLVEYYLPPFQQCARDSKVGSIMCAYNAVNGTPACANTYLMQTVLREHWGWTDENQYITSDCNAVQNFYADHHWVETAAEAAAKAYAAGTDTVCEYNSVTDVIGAWNQTLLDEETIDKALNRLYHGLVRVGYFDPPSASEYRSLGWNDVNTEEAQMLALHSAVDGIVLKKNDGTLPLTYDEKMETSAAVIGHWGDNAAQLLGGYPGRAPYYVTPRYVSLAIHGATFYAAGPVAQTSNDRDTWTEAAVEAASQADIVLYFGGNDMTMEREDHDRVAIGWPEAQLTLINEICALGKPCIVVQMGDQMDDSPLLENKNVSAIVWAGYPGQAGGTAVFDILYGKSAPAGRLPVTQYPASYVDEVPMTDMSLRPSQYNPGRTYKWYNDAVLPFGFGLHYTEFNAKFTFKAKTRTKTKSYEMDHLLGGCEEHHRDLCSFDNIAISVENKGDVDSDFVALVFVNGTGGPAPHPLKELVGYMRLKGVKAGSVEETEVNLTLGDIARVDERGNTVLYAGIYSLLLDVPTQDMISFEITGEDVLLDAWPQPPEDLGAL